MWKAIITWLRNFFGFSRTEANGFVLLLLLMLVVLFAPLINKQILLKSHPDVFLTSDYQQLDSLLALWDERLITSDTSEIKSDASSKDNVVVQNFDPNTINSLSLQSLGFPQFLAERIIKYRSLVKPFQKAEDLLLIYGMDSSLYRKLKPYITIEAKASLDSPSEINNLNSNRDSANNNFKSYRKSPEKFKLQSFDINTADTAKLRRIYGIGAIYAQRIIDYRDLLGGFANKSQYDEIYGLQKPNIDSLKKYAEITETLQLRHLKLNTSSEEELSSHPYISYKQAKLIVRYRNAHGAFSSVEDLMKIKVIDSSFTQKIKPYLLIKP